MDPHLQDPSRLAFNPNSTSSVDGVDKISDQPEVAKAKAKNLSEICQKYIFSKPFTKETLGVDKLEIKHKVFNVFFTTTMALTLPFMLPIWSARLCYVANMEAKEMKKGQALLKAMEESCGRLDITIPETLKGKINNIKNFDNSKHITDKPFIRANNEVIKELSNLVASKSQSLDKELLDLVALCKKEGFMVESGENGKFRGDLNNLSDVNKSIIGGEIEKITIREEFLAVKELKEKMGNVFKPLPIPSKQLTDNEIAEFKCENGMKDFIKCGAGFTASEVSVDDTTQVTKKIHKEINAEAITMGLVAIYPKVLDENGMRSDKVLEDLESAITNAQQAASETDRYSAQGGLSQSTRVLDITLSMIESNLYTPLIVQDLAKGDQSRIKHIIDQSSNFPELQSRKDRLEKLIQNQANSILEIKTSAEDINVFKTNLSNVRKGKLNESDLKSLAESMAQDSKEICISLFKKMDGREILKPAAGCLGLIAYSDHLSYVVANDILDGKTPKEVKNSIEFYTKVAQSAVEKGDFLTANALVTGALQAGSVTNLTHPPSGGTPFVTLSQTHVVSVKERSEGKTGNKDLDMLKNLFDPKSASKNLREAQAEAKELIPFIGLPLGDIANADASEKINYGSQKNLENISNPEYVLSMGKLLKDVSIASGLKGGTAENCKGFSASVLDIKFTAEDPLDNSKTIPITVTKAMEGLYGKSKELRSKVEARKSTPVGKNKRSDVEVNKKRRSL